MRTRHRRVAGRLAASTSAPDRRGFSLVELMVAMMLLSVGVLGLVGVSAMAMRQTNDANNRNIAALVAATRMETLRSRTCASLANGGPVETSGVTERWTVVNPANPLTRTITGQFTYRAPRGYRNLNVSTTVPCT